eukprot:8764154-Alexandrium_andersonii.AAC.1
MCIRDSPFPPEIDERRDTFREVRADLPGGCRGLLGGAALRAFGLCARPLALRAGPVRLWH